MSLLDYTTYADVRAILGVSSTELPDRTLELNTYSFQADLALTDIYASLPTLFATIKANTAPTDTEKTLENVVILYYGYVVAKVLLSALPMFSVKTLDDGRASYSRQNDVFSDVRDGVDAALSALKTRLVALINTLVPGAIAGAASAVRTHVLSVPLAIDPVTGV